MRRPLLSALVLAALALNAHARFIATAIGDPSVTWQYVKVNGYHVDIQAAGLFYQTMLEADVSLNTRYEYPGCTQPPARPFEMSWTFSLPSEFAVTGAWLYDNAASAFRPCSLLSITAGMQHFAADTVSRPGLLLRVYPQRSYSGTLSNLYRLSVAPVEGVGQRVRMRVAMLAPCTMRWGARDLTMAGMCLYTGYGCDPTVASAGLTVLDYDNPSGPPHVFDPDSAAQSWSLSQGSWYMVAASGQAVADGTILRIGDEYPGLPYLHTQGMPDGRTAYELAVLPHIPAASLPHRRIVLAIDLREGTGIPRDEALWAVAEPLAAATSTSDSIAGLVSAFAPKWLDTAFVACSPQAISRIIDSARQNVPKLPNLPFMLREAVSFLNRGGGAGEVWVVSNDADHGAPAERVMELLRQTYFAATGSVVFRIVDASSYSYATRITVGGVYYNGNDYLYENLARLSGGALTNLDGCPWYNMQDMVIDNLSPTVAAVEIDPQPAGGRTHSRYDLNRGRTTFNAHSRYYQIGIAEGQAPYDVAYNGYFDGALYSQTIPASDVTKPALADAAMRYWYASHTRDLLDQPQTAERISSIEQESLTGHVLSAYSGLVVPSSSGYIGFRKLVETDFADSGSAPVRATATVPECARVLKAWLSGGVLVIDLAWAHESPVCGIVLLDMKGRTVKRARVETPRAGSRGEVRLSTAELGLSPGMFVVRVSDGAATQSVRLVVNHSRGGI